MYMEKCDEGKNGNLENKSTIRHVDSRVGQTGRGDGCGAEQFYTQIRVELRTVLWLM